MNIDEQLLKDASELTGIKDKTVMVHLALETLISLEVRKQLIALGGTQKQLRPIPRRRSSTAKKLKNSF